jgi:formylglycine-generating enzyme required for sulfatase activity
MECTLRVPFAGTDCLGYRLPTEAEWEYAARAGTTTVFWSGDEVADLDGVGWHLGNSAMNDAFETHPVGQLRANPWGLFDVHGNVLEWVHDWHRAYGAAERTDPPGPGRTGGLNCEQACARFDKFCGLDQLMNIFLSDLDSCVATCPHQFAPQCVEELILRRGECPIDAFNDCRHHEYNFRGYRGGSSSQIEGDCRSAKRAYNTPSLRSHVVGFRVLRRVP